MNLALFDFDGTISTREMYPDFVHFAVPPLRLSLGKLLLAPVIAGYKLGWVPGNVIRASILALAFRGVAEDVLRELGERFAREMIATALRPEAMARIRWHQAQGDTVVVVSGSLDVYLAPWCAQHGLQLFCSEVGFREGRATGRYSSAQCVGEEKARRVREHFDLSRFDSVFAYGDTHEDQALLGMADRRWYRWQEA